jgi:hypothetical protein
MRQAGAHTEPSNAIKQACSKVTQHKAELGLHPAVLTNTSSGTAHWHSSNTAWPQRPGLGHWRCMYTTTHEDTGAQIFQKSRGHFIILVVRRDTWSEFHTGTARILGTAVNIQSPRKSTTSLNTTRPSTVFYRLLLNWASLRRHQERSLKMAM